MYIRTGKDADYPIGHFNSNIMTPIQTMEQLRRVVFQLAYEKRFQEAITYAEQWAKMSLEYFPKGSLESGYSMNALASLLIEVKEYQKAEFLLLKAKVILENAAIVPETDIALLCFNIGHCYLSCQRLEEATAVVQEGISRLESKGLADHQSYYKLVDCLERIATQYYQTNNYDTCLVLALKVLKIKDIAYGKTHLEYSKTLNNLAFVYLALEDVAQAEVCAKEAVQIRYKLALLDPMAILEAENTLFEILNKGGKDDESLALLSRQLASNLQYFGPYSRPYALTLSKMADVHHKKEDYVQACYFYEQAFQLVVRDNDYQALAILLNNLGNSSYYGGQSKQAEKWYRQSFSVYIRHFAIPTDEFATLMDDLVVFFEEEKRPAEMVGFYRTLAQQISASSQLPALEYLAWIESACQYCNRHTLFSDALYFGELILRMVQVYHLDPMKAANYLLDTGLWSIKTGSIAAGSERLTTAITQLEPMVSREVLIDRIRGIGEFLRKYHQFQLALPYLKRAYEMNALSEPDSFQTGMIASSLGLTYREVFEYDASVFYLEKSLKIAAASDIVAHKASVAIAHKNLAQTYGELKKSQIAEMHYREALNLNKAIFGDDSPEAIAVLNDMCYFFSQIGHIEEATHLSNEIIAIHKKRGTTDPFDLALSLNQQAIIYRQSGQFLLAVENLLQSLTLMEQIGERGRYPYAKVCTNLGSVYASMNQLTEAQRYLERAKEALTELYGPGNTKLIGALSNLGSVLNLQGNIKEALDYYTAAATIVETSLDRNNPVAWPVFANIASVYLGIGARDTARSFLQKIQAHYRNVEEMPIEFIFILGNLHLSYDLDGHKLEAEEILLEALNLAEKGKLTDPTEKILLYEIAAQFYARQGQYTYAWEMLLPSINAVYNLINDHLPYFSASQQQQFLQKFNSLNNLAGSLALQLADSDQNLLPEIFELLANAQGISFETLSWQRKNLMLLLPDVEKVALEKTTKLQLAITHIAAHSYYRALTVDEEQQLQALKWEKKALEEALLAKLYSLKLAIPASKISIAKLSETLKTDQAVIFIVRFQKHNFQIRHDAFNPQPGHYLAIILCAGGGGQPVFVDIGEAGMVEDSIAAFRSRLTKVPEHRFTVEHKLSDFLKAAKEPLPQEPMTGETSSSIEPQQQADARGIFSFNDITPPESTPMTALLEPIIKALPESIKHCLILPQGDFTRLPFGAVPTKDGRLWDDRYWITYLNSLHELLAPANISRHLSKDSVVLADPNYGTTDESFHTLETEDSLQTILRSSRYRFSPLPGARQEGEAVADLLKAKLFTENQATKSALLAIDAPRILHIASHGFFVREPQKIVETTVAESVQLFEVPGEGTFLLDIKPFEQYRPDTDPFSISLNPFQRTGLALAGINQWLAGKSLPDDFGNGMLTADEATELNLQGTDLVVLSACETGLGIYNPEQGVLGLRRAFALAGAKAQIVSLWKVPDKATLQLMVTFYQSLQEGTSYAQAFSKAKNTLREQYPGAFFWSAFVYFGDVNLRYG